MERDLANLRATQAHTGRACEIERRLIEMARTGSRGACGDRALWRLRKLCPSSTRTVQFQVQRPARAGKESRSHAPDQFQSSQEAGPTRSSCHRQSNTEVPGPPAGGFCSSGRTGWYPAVGRAGADLRSRALGGHVRLAETEQRRRRRRRPSSSLVEVLRRAEGEADGRRVRVDRASAAGDRRLEDWLTRRPTVNRCQRRSAKYAARTRSTARTPKTRSRRWRSTAST